MKLVTIKAPKKENPKETIEISGYMVRFYVGQYQQKFLMQTGHDGIPVALSHYESGGFVCPIYTPTVKSARANALLALMRMENRFGADKINNILNSATAIN